MDTDSFIVNVKTDDIYKDTEENVETRMDTYIKGKEHYIKGKVKEVIGLMKDELGGQIMKEVFELR